MAFDNFTVNIVSFPEIAGVDWTLDNPSIVLTLIPDPGYTINASNFSAVAPLPSYVSSVTFSQNGFNPDSIDCVINYIEPSIMPSTDVLISLCVDGFAEFTSKSISGTVKSCGLTNVSVPQGGDLPSTYTSSGNWSATSPVFTQAVAAATGYYFNVTPILWLSIGNTSNYTITDVKTYNSSGQLTQIVFTATYTFSTASVTGDEICLTANAVSIYAPPTEIVAYSFNSNNIAIGGETRTFTIRGIEGANWALTAEYTPGNINIVNTSGTIDATGQAAVNVIFPPTSVDRVYTFILTGDLSSTFDTSGGQPSTIALNQWIDTTLSLGLISTNSDITVGAVDSNTFIPGNASFNLPFTYTVSATSTANIVVASPILISDWTNQNLSRPQYDFVVTNQVITVDNAPTPSTFTAVVDIEIFGTGTPSILSVLNLDNHIQGALVPVSLSFGSTSSIACCSATATPYFVASGETFLTAIAILDASGNPAADGFYKQ